MAHDSSGSDGASERPNRRLLGRLWRALRVVRRGSMAEVAEALAGGDRHEPIDAPQREMILKAASFDKLRVADVMTPRAAIVALDVDCTLAEAARDFSESQHSRLPIYRDTLDDALGFVHVKDVLALLAPDENGEVHAQFADRPLGKLKREILFAPGSMRLATLLLKMQTQRIHLALVVDEYGGTDGLVSIEDLVEQIVGEIDDEHDEATPGFVQSRPGGQFDVDGRADIADLEAALGSPLSFGDEEAEYDTAAGLAVALAGRLPQRGEILRHPAGFDLEVLDADPRRVKRLRFKPAARATAAGERP